MSAHHLIFAEYFLLLPLSWIPTFSFENSSAFIAFIYLFITVCDTLLRWSQIDFDACFHHVFCKKKKKKNANITLKLSIWRNCWCLKMHWFRGGVAHHFRICLTSFGVKTYLWVTFVHSIIRRDYFKDRFAFDCINELRTWELTRKCVVVLFWVGKIIHRRALYTQVIFIPFAGARTNGLRSIPPVWAFRNKP